MAEKPESQITIDEKIAKAKELYGRGTRNFFVDSYADAADDLSQACSIYSDLYGPNADELGPVYLIYAKSLIAVAQDENKLMDIPEEEDDDNDEEEKNDDEKEIKDDVENGTEATDDVNGCDKTDENDKNILPSTSSVNGDGDDDDKDGGDEGDADCNADEEDDAVASLQVAWEVLEIAAKIFERQGDTNSLAETYGELANISFENSFFDLAIKDYKRSFDTYTDLMEPNRRILAELKYKIGLCYTMLSDYKEAVDSLKSACSIFDDEIEVEKSKPDSDAKKLNIKDLEETKQEILNKIAEIEETKQQSIEEVKKELTKLIGNIGGSNAESPTSSGAGSSKDANSTTPTDISHLIKRKKPDNEVQDNKSGDNPPPAKKPSL